MPFIDVFCLRDWFCNYMIVTVELVSWCVIKALSRECFVMFGVAMCVAELNVDEEFHPSTPK